MFAISCHDIVQFGSLINLMSYRSTYLTCLDIDRLRNMVGVPQCMFPRRNWDYPTPSPSNECAPPPGSKRAGGGGHSPAGEDEEAGESQFRRPCKKS